MTRNRRHSMCPSFVGNDRVMVLYAGQLERFTTPYQRIQAKAGILFELFCNLNADAQVKLRCIRYTITDSAHARRQHSQW